MTLTSLPTRSIKSPPRSTGFSRGGSWNYPLAFALYAGVILSLFLPTGLMRLVVSNNDQSADLGLVSQSRRMTFEKFNDLPDSYIPDIQEALRGQTRNWIATWTPWAEFGKPIDHLDNVGTAYLPYWLLSFAIKDAWTFITVVSFGWVFLSGTFLFLFLRENKLHPLACAVASIGLASSPMIFYWLTFPMFESVYACTLALLWLVRRATRSRRVWRSSREQLRTITSIFAPRTAAVPTWLAIAFASYSMLMCVYPQMTAHVMYIGVIYASVCVWRCSTRTVERSKAVVFIVSAVAAGGLCALPVYLDTLTAARLSGRMEVPLTYFVSVIPTSENFQAILRNLLLAYDAHRFGSPISSKFSATFDGFCVTPVFGSFLLAAFFFKSARSQWGWILALAICASLSYSARWYGLFVDFIPGFRFSRCGCLSEAMIPAFILIAYSLSEVLQSGVHFRLASVASAAVLGIFSLSLLIDHHVGASPRGAAFFLMEWVLVAGVIWSLFGNTRALVAVSIITPWFFASTLMMLQPRDAIRNDSPLVQAIRRHLPRQARLAIAGERDAPIGVLLPNSEGTLGIASVHVYDPLASKSYIRVMQELGASVIGYQKIFPIVGTSSLSTIDAFSYGNIGLVLSARPLADRGLFLAEHIGRFFLYSPIRSPRQIRQIDLPPRDGELHVSGPLRKQPGLESGVEEERGDFLKVATTPVRRPTVLFVSRQYLPSWEADVRVGNELQPAQVVRVNDLFTGIELPPGTTEARLEFHPWVLWTIVPNVFFLLAAVVYILPVFSRKLVDNAVLHLRLPGADSALFAGLLSISLCSGWFLWQGRVGINLQDEGFLWYGAERTLAGEVPIRDFGSYDPGRYYWCYACMKVLHSDGLLELRLAVLAFASVGIFAAIRAMQTMFRNPWMLTLFAAVLVIWLFPRHKMFEHSLALSCVFFGNQLIRKPTLRWHFLSGLFAGGCAFVGRNIGLYSCVSLGLLVLFLICRVDRSSAISKVGLLLCGVAVGFLPFVGMCLFVPGFGHALIFSLRELFNGTESQIAIPVLWPWRLGSVDAGLPDTFSRVGLSFALLAMPVVLFGVLIGAVVLKRGTIETYSLAIAGAFAGITWIHHGFSRPDAAHYSQAVHPMLLCLIGLCAAGGAWRMLRVGSALVLVGLTVGLSQTLIPSMALAALPVDARASMLIDGQTFQVTASQKQILNALGESYLRYVHPGEGFAAGPLYPFAYSYLHVASPWYDHYMLYKRPAEWQEGMIDQLQERHVALIMLSTEATVDGRADMTFTRTHPIVWDYIQSAYRRVDREAFEGDTGFWVLK